MSCKSADVCNIGSRIVSVSTHTHGHTTAAPTPHPGSTGYSGRASHRNPCMTLASAAAISRQGTTTSTPPHRVFVYAGAMCEDMVARLQCSLRSGVIGDQAHSASLGLMSCRAAPWHPCVPECPKETSETYLGLPVGVTPAVRPRANCECLVLM